MKKLFVFLMVVGLLVAGSGMASASFSVSLVPDSLNVAPGSTVNVSVNMSDSPGFTMTAINAIINYDPDVFTYVDPSVVQGAFLNDDWSGGFPMGAATNPGELIVGAIDWTNFNGELLATGAGTLFTFTLLAKTDAPLGSSLLTWGNGSFLGDGFGYGDADGHDVLVPSTGVSINVGSAVPIPAAFWLLGSGLIGLVGLRRKFRK